MTTVSIFKDNYKKNVICPECRGIKTRKIPKERFFRVVFFWLSVNRYLCTTCRHKFYKRD